MALNSQEYGNQSGPFMLFLHGGGVSSWMWEKQIQYFKNYHCVVIDLPGHGSNAHIEDFTIEESATRLVEFIKQFANEKKIIVIGFSLGAQVLIQSLSLAPNLIDYAVINSALVRPSKIGKMSVRPMVKLTFPLIKNKTFSKLQAKMLYVNEEQFEKYYKESLKMKRHTLIQVLEENMSYDIPRKFSESTAKILVTVGAKEKRLMKKSAIDIGNHHPNSKVMMISDMGHGFPLATPDLFNQMVGNWLIAEGGLDEKVFEI